MKTLTPEEVKKILSPTPYTKTVRIAPVTLAGVEYNRALIIADTTHVALGVLDPQGFGYCVPNPPLPNSNAQGLVFFTKDIAGLTLLEKALLALKVY